MSCATEGKSLVPLSCSFLICHIGTDKTSLEPFCLRHHGCKTYEDQPLFVLKVRGRINDAGDPSGLSII